MDKPILNQQNVQRVVEFLTEFPGYIKRGKHNIAHKLACTPYEVQYAKDCVRGKHHTTLSTGEISNTSISTKEVPTEELGNDNDTESKITEFDKYLETQGIAPDNVKSVKYWQTAGGDYRFSVVTKAEETRLPSIEDVQSLLKDITPFQMKELEATSDTTLVVYLSDKHIGADVPSTALYENPYTEEELLERLRKVFEEITKTYLEYGILTELVLVDLGDALDGYNGQTVRGGHKLPQNMGNVEAFNLFISAHKQFYEGILRSEMAEKVTIVHLCSDNHSGDFGYFANRALQEYLKTAYEGDFTFHISRYFIEPLVRKDFTLLFTHGKDDEDMRNGLPLHLNPATETYIIDYLLNKGISTKNLHFIKGDLHQATTEQGKHFRYRNIPSVFGSSKWVMANFGYTKPGCGFDLFEGSKVKQWELWF